MNNKMTVGNLIEPIVFVGAVGSVVYFAPKLLEAGLREKPYETSFSRLIDRVSSRVVYKNRKLSLQELQVEVEKFGQVEKIIWRGRWIPAGDVISRTAKATLENCNGQEAYQFIRQSLPAEMPKNTGVVDENKLYSSEDYYATLRNIRKGSWLHVHSRTSF